MSITQSSYYVKKVKKKTFSKVGLSFVYLYFLGGEINSSKSSVLKLKQRKIDDKNGQIFFNKLLIFLRSSFLLKSFLLLKFLHIIFIIIVTKVNYQINLILKDDLELEDKLCLSKKEYLMQRQSTSMRVISYLMIKGEPTLRFNQFFYFSQCLECYYFNSNFNSVEICYDQLQS